MASPKVNGGKTQASKEFERQQYAIQRDGETLEEDAAMIAFPSTFSVHWQVHGRLESLHDLEHTGRLVARCHRFHLGNGISSTLETRKTR